MRVFRCAFIVAVVWIVVGGCGGAGTPEAGSVENCRSEFAELAAEDQVCDPIVIEQLENTVKDWQRTCSIYADHTEKRQIDDLLVSSRKCSEQRQQLEALKAQCTRRIAAIEERAACEGTTCFADLQELSEIIEHCSNPQLSSDAMSKAIELRGKVEQRIALEKQIAVLDTIARNCEAQKSVAEEQKAEEAFRAVVKALAGNEVLNMKEQGPAQLADRRKTTLAACGEIVLSTVQSMTDAVAEELSNKRLKRKAGLWMERYTVLEKIGEKLGEINAEALFPEAAALHAQTLDEFKLEKEKLEETAQGQQIRTVRRTLTKGAKKCQKLHKDIKKYELKVAAYTKKGNERKTKAYSARLAKTKTSLEELEKGLSQGIAAKALPEKELQRVIKQLSAAGCPVAKSNAN